MLDFLAQLFHTSEFRDKRGVEEALRASEERLRLALNAGFMSVWDRNLRTNEMQWSENFEQVHGLAPGTFDGRFDTLMRLVHPRDRELVEDTVRRAIEQQGPFEIEFRNVWPDGSIHWFVGKGKVFADETGQAARMIGVGQDITARKRNEQTLQFLAEAGTALAGLVDYESTLRNVARLAVTFFADWCVVDIAEPDGSVRRLAVVHADPNKLELARELERRFPADANAKIGVMNVLRTGRAEIMADIPDSFLLTSAGSEEHVRILRELGLKSSLCVPLSARGRTLGVLSFFVAESGRRFDAHDLNVAEDLACRATIAIENARLYAEVRDADQRKDEFLATLAHELRNPLAPIRNALQIVRMPNADSDMIERARNVMERQVQHLVRLVDDLLDVSRIMRGKIELRMERVDLASVVARAVETAQPIIDAQGHELTIALPPEPLPLQADAIRLAQIISNLLTNAAKYTPSAGQIVLSAERADDQMVLQVRDTGIGIAPETLPRVFDMFMQVDHSVTRTHGGLGIGLTLVRKLVELQGGSVQAKSEGLGKGSEFIVRLPISRSTVAQPVNPDRPAHAGGGLPPHRILVVDDNVDAAESMAMLLRLLNQDVRVVHDGWAALSAAKAYQPDVVLLDIGLPGLNGYNVARKLREQPEFSKILIVAMTGWGQEQDRRRSQEAGFDHHLTKPADPGVLEHLLAGKQ